MWLFRPPGWSQAQSKGPNSMVVTAVQSIMCAGGDVPGPGRSALLDELSLDFLLLIDVEPIQVDPEDRAAAPEGGALDPLLESGGLNSEGGSGQWHVSNFCHVLRAVGGKIQARDRLDLRADGCGCVDIDE